MKEREELTVYRKKDIDKVVGFVGNLGCKGIVAARKLALITGILEIGRPLKEYIEEEEKGEDV